MVAFVTGVCSSVIAFGTTRQTAAITYMAAICRWKWWSATVNRI
jgi:hypothetical protein